MQESESDNEYDEQVQEQEELYSGSDSEYYQDSDVDYDDRVDPRDDMSDELSDGDERELRLGFAAPAGVCPDLEGLL